ncbi:hypothetical protein FIU94_15635 [Sulfitobacter sp. THAF37]|uniref:glycosyltransferase family 2 protein n=1 Tax=Sulfitobacter sp. THAF37 TaxID=2587855 RepID=UPI0012693F38|nr:glycosyltransferase family 2 protein [Sulfitobacter sp. THAF37]QFT60259.1 hypothetical protein FIU94_15635 [Sulfitobacter sp. THAF37]
MTPRWGLVATIRAEAEDILRFAAYHLEAGAHRIFIYLDEPCPEAQQALQDHPKCRVILCDTAHWKALIGKRPVKHQSRQTLNATHAYGRAGDVTWLAHIDVDEFLVSDRPVADVLAALPSGVETARARPMEMLGGDGTAFKRFIPNGPNRERIVNEIYPTFGEYVKGGFISHLAGKVFVRTGMEGITIRIHNAFRGPEMIEETQELDGIHLAHAHATSWDKWQAAYRFRLEKGSYRANLGPAKPRARGGLTLNEFFAILEAEEGEAGLRAFFEEVCADTPDHRARLAAHDLLHLADLRLSTHLATHFPAWSS